MSMIGTSVIRKEDPELLTVGGKYVDDLAPADAAHLTFVRSVMAHAEISGVDTTEAAAMPGVIAVLTAADLGLDAGKPGYPMLNQEMTREWLATDRVRYVGEPIAVVVSETREVGVDAAELVLIDYEPLEVVVTAEDAATDRVLLYPEVGTNSVWAQPVDDEDGLFDGAEVVVEKAFKNQRMATAPIEPRAAAAKWEPGDNGELRLTQWSSTQFPHGTRGNLAGAIGVEESSIRVITPDVGGGFGAKGGSYPEDVVTAVVARHIGRPTRWTETRTESMLSMGHARAQDYTATIAGTRDGRITAYKLHVLQDCGAYPTIGALLPLFTKIMASGVYDIPRVSASSNSVLTNTSPIGAFRGAGRPEATSALERMIDLFAAEVGMDPVDVRRMNFLAPEAFPHKTPTGADMDSGEYAKALDAVIDAADYAGLRVEQERRRATADEPLLGLGWSTYVEITNPMGASEFGSMEVRPDGSALVLTGSSAHGQGHHTVFAQLASGVTGIPIDRIEVRHGDTDEVPRGGGTGGSRSLQVGGTAVATAAEEVVARAKEIAADLLEANPDDITLDTGTGTFSVVGTPAVSRDWASVAGHLQEKQDLLKSEVDFAPDGPTFPFGAHLSVVEVDRETGEVTPIRHIACDDAGVIVNPLVVDGQVHGGLASGMGHALMEEFVYDADGNPQTANLMDYGLPSAAELPSFDRIPLETPTTRNPIGAKGIGESGTIGATPAVHNAVIDAVAHLGVRHIEMPTTAQRVWEAINGAD